MKKVPETVLKNGAPKRRQMDMTTPIGISCADLTFVPRPFTNPNVLVAGGLGCGKTSFLLSTVNAIVRQYRPDEAQIVIADPNYGMLSCRDWLKEAGYLLGYADNRDKFASVLADVSRIITPRFPTDDVDLSTDNIQGRSWYTGPDVFLIVDNVHRLVSASPTGGGFGRSAGESPEDALARLTSRVDVGLNIYMTTTDSKFATARQTNKLMAPLAGNSAPLFLMSGSRDEGSITGRTKFAKRRPGQGLFCDLSRDERYFEVVQVPHAYPWDSPGAAPAQELLEKAKAIAATMGPVLPPIEEGDVPAPAAPAAERPRTSTIREAPRVPVKQPEATGTTRESIKSSGKPKSGKSFKWG